jgi:hypothetical protein
MPDRLQRPLRLAVIAAVLASAAVAAVALLAHFGLFVRRAGFPLDLEWMEGGMLAHAARLASGRTIYAAPSLEFIPFLYTPLYPALLALLSKLLPLGYLLGRLVSIASFAGALALIVWAAARQAGPRRSLPGAVALAAGVAGAGAVAAAFAFSGSFFDLVRADSLLLLLEAGALALALSGGGRRRAALAGLCIALAFFTKQTASVMGIAIGLGLLLADWRRAVSYGLAAAGALGAGLLLLQATSDGWFWRYVFELHQSHGFNARLAYVETPLRLLRQGAPAYLALAAATGGLLALRRLERADALHLLCALGGFFAACVGFGTQWAFDNAFIPAVYFPLFSAALLSARLAAEVVARPAPARLAAGAALACLALGVQTVASGVLPDGRRFIPAARDRQAAARFLDGIRQLEGPLFIPFHPWYAVLAGQPPHVHRMGVLDVAAQLGRPAGLDQALASGHFAHVILDWKSQPWEWPTLDQRYHDVHQYSDGVDAVRSFSGAETSPRRLLARTVPAPPPPSGARLLADFESGYAGFVPAGDAYGTAPAPALAGLHGRAAADSRRYGPAAQGALRSPPITVDRGHLRFTLVGPADPGLRVLLLDGPEVARSAAPGGRPQVVDWDLADLRGRSVTLVIDDRSASAGLAVDDVLLY